MPFIDDPERKRGVTALREGFDLNPDVDAPEGSVLGAAFRSENPIGSLLVSIGRDRNEPFDLSYRPWDDIQGTIYEPHSHRFHDVRNPDQAAQMKAQIDREMEDARVLDAAGGWGMLAEVAAGILSPTSLLPGGAVVKGVKGGVSIGKTSMSVAAWSGAAVALDELALQSTQETRSAAESVAAIGGGVILGGLLGSAAGSMSRAAFKRSAAIAEEIPEAVDKFNQALLGEMANDGSVGAARVQDVDLTLRREGVLNVFKDIPILRNVVRTDPLLRRQLSPLQESRKVTSRLVESVLQYEVNEQGLAPNAGNVEGRIKTRKNIELAQTVGFLERSYAEFVKDGPVGSLGRVTAPVVGRFSHLLGGDKKMTRTQFYEEVGRAMRRGDQHPIPQIQKAADEVRKAIFDKAKNDAIEIGMFDDALDTMFADSYLSRVYNPQKIIAHRGDGSDKDLVPVLLKNMEQKQQAAITRLENDKTVEQVQADLLQTRQQARGAARALRKATDKARGKRDRAKGAVKREQAVSRATDGLRAHFDKRRAKLLQKTAKGYRREASTEWREAMVMLGRGDKPQNAGKVVDDISRQQSNAASLMDCLAVATAKTCIANLNMTKAERDEVRSFIGKMDDPELGAQAYANALQRRREEVQQALADAGHLVDLTGDMPEPSLYQNVAASIRSARSALNNRPPDILQAVRAMGGFKKDTDGGELKVIFDDRARTLIKNDGLDPDHMREALVEAGYLPDGADLNDMWDFLRQAEDGEEIFSRLEFAEEIDAYESANAFADELEEMGLNISEVSVDDIVGLETALAKRQDDAKVKAGEADRSAKVSDKKTAASSDRMLSALQRLEEADARLVELNEIVSPKVKAEVKAAREDAVKLVGKFRDAKKARDADQQLANMDADDIREVVDDTIDSIIGMKPGEHSFGVTMSKPTRARVLDVADVDLEPWLESDVGVIMSQYFNNIVPDIELTREFGDVNLTEQKKAIIEEGRALSAQAKSEKQRKAIDRETREAITDLDGMKDRMRGRYGVPDNPRNIVTVAGRTMRSLSYTGYLGGMTFSALPDLAGIVGRNGIEAAFGSLDALTDPKRLKMAAEDAADIGAAAEWYLNSRAVSMAELTDEYGATSRFERGVATTARLFSHATGMIAWNAGWKSVGGAMIGSRISKLAVKVKEGKATKKDLLKLSENGIDTTTALKIADQIEKHGDTDGRIWLPKAADWDNQIAKEAMIQAFNREMDLMIITPGQDKPLMFSTEGGKFFSQFKSFTSSAHHRIMLSGIQRADAHVLAQITMAIALGMAVSRYKAWIGGYDQKEGTALWEDAIDRAGIGGWFFEAHGIANGMTGGALSLSGEEVSRYGARSSIEGLLGPSVDMGINWFEGVSAFSRGDMTARDARNVLRPAPGNNLPYFMNLTKQISEAMAEFR